MLERITQGFFQATSVLRGATTLTPDKLDEASRHIRIALLEGDVEIGVVRRFIGRIKERATGEVIQLRKGNKVRSVADAFTHICYRELVALLGAEGKEPIAFHKPVTTLMLVGLQGVGKTTTAAKLSRTLKAQGRRPLLVAADTQRPAAQKQLELLGEKIDVPVWFVPGQDAVTLSTEAKAEAKRRHCDVIVLDTAGRLAIDEPLMAELRGIKDAASPHEILLVCDAMAGQDTVRTAQIFNEQLDVSGFVLTKLDSDARGGAALSLRELCHKPIKFVGTGEDTRALERFRPEGMASRILGMGDLRSLLDDFDQVVDQKQAEQDSKKLLRGQFGLDDFLSQLRLIKKMGPLQNLLGKIPGMQNAQLDTRQLGGIEALIQSMTPQERKTPAIIDAQRRRRIARGAGRKEEELSSLLERFASMQQMMGAIGKQPGMGKTTSTKGLKGLLGGAAPGSIAAPRLGGLPKLPGMPPLGAAPTLGNQAGGADGQLSAEQAQLLERLQGQLGGGPSPARSTISVRERKRQNDKRKAERKARKKARR